MTSLHSYLVFTWDSLQLAMEELKLKSKYIRLINKTRLYELDIPIIGLTGGIATGKSTVASELKRLNIPVIDADGLIKYIYQKEESISFIKHVAPAAITNNSINFSILREQFFNDKELKLKVEEFLYSKLPEAFKFHLEQFINPKFVIYDVPLLFEKNLEKLIDSTILVYAPRDVQMSRLIDRDNSSTELACKILNQQDDIETKRSKASIIIENTEKLSELASKIQVLRQDLFE